MKQPHGVNRDKAARSDLVEDVADLLEADPGYTLEGLALRLRRSRDSITVALRRSAREGDQRATAIRAHLSPQGHPGTWKDIAS